MNWYDHVLSSLRTAGIARGAKPNARPSPLLKMRRVRDLPMLRLNMIVDHANAVRETGKLRLMQHHFSQLGLETPATVCEKWLDVARKHKDEIRKLMEPIYVHRVKDGYFVDDGNHRVWFARKLGLLTIQAVEYEYR